VTNIIKNGIELLDMFLIEDLISFDSRYPEMIMNTANPHKKKNYLEEPLPWQYRNLSKHFPTSSENYLNTESLNMSLKAPKILLVHSSYPLANILSVARIVPSIKQRPKRRTMES